MRSPRLFAAHAAQSPAAPTPATRVQSRPAANHDELTTVVRTYCRTCHNDRTRSGNLSLEGFDVAGVAQSAQTADTAEKMIRKLRAKMMPPPGMPRPAADTLRTLAETLEATLDHGGCRQSEPGQPDVPAFESRRVRARHSRPLRTRDQRRRFPPARHDERELRQHRRRADPVADPAGRLPESRRRSQPTGGGQPGRDRDRDDLPEVENLLAMGLGRRRAVRHPRRHLRRPQLPRRRRVRLQDGVPAHHHRRRVGIDDPRRTDRDFDQRRAGRVDGHGSVRQYVRSAGCQPRDGNADRREGGPAARVRRVRPSIRWSGRGPARPTRLVHRRYRDRRQGLWHYRVAAHEGAGDCRSVQGHGRVRHAEPPQNLHVPSRATR